ncbi:MAG: 3-isopropylmalate dehydratase small subunit [Gemmatimonadales bacterium]
MIPFTRHTGRVAALPRANVDTDQIVPKQFLRRIERTGLGRHLFHDWRYLPDGTPDPAFELNHPKANDATVLVAGVNFGCGSSREHAPWALGEYGFRAIVAPSFADIFFTNCCQNGLLPVRLGEAEVEALVRRYDTAADAYELTVDLERQQVSDADGFSAGFEIDPYRREMLLLGLDEIGRTLLNEGKIAAFERAGAGGSRRDKAGGVR